MQGDLWEFHSPERNRDQQVAKSKADRRRIFGLALHQYLVNPRPQWELIAYSLFMLTAMMGAGIIALQRFFDQLTAPENANLLPPPGHPFHAMLASQAEALQESIILIYATTAFFFFVGLLIFSNRLVGPLVRVQRLLAQGIGVSLPFDASSKVNKPIVSFFNNSKALVLESTAGSRTTVRRLLSSVGVKTSNVEAMGLIGDAIPKMESLKPNIIFTELDLGDRNGLELMEIHKKQYPNSLNTIFILLSSKNSPIITSMAADSDTDGLIIKPFTYAMVEDKLIAVAKTKALPTHYLKSIESAKALIREKKSAEALTTLQEALKLDPKPALAHALIGEIRLEQGDLLQAQKQFEAGLKTVPTHYKSLIGLFQCHSQNKEYDKAYKVGQMITKVHTLPPSRIPDFVRSSVFNHKYEEVLALYDLVTNIDRPDPIVTRHVSAGMVICSKLYLRNKDLKKALELLQKTQKLCGNQIGIQAEIILTLINAGMADEADKMFAKLPDEIKNMPRMLALEVQKLVHLGKPMDALNVGMKLVEQQAHCVQLYELMIEQAAKQKCSDAYVANLISKGSTAFPEKASHFEALKAHPAKDAK